MASLADKLRIELTEALSGQVETITRDALSNVDVILADALAKFRVDAAAQLDALAATPRPELEFTPEVPDPKADATERALRTARQGAIGVAASVALTLGDALATPGFDPTAMGDWKLVLGAIGATAVASAASFVSRLVKAPKSQR